MSAGNSAMVKIAGEPQAGFFKKRQTFKDQDGKVVERRWAPVRIWLRLGEVDEAGDKMEPDLWIGEWNPSKDNPFAFYPINVWNDWEGLFPIDEEEYQWLLTLKTL
jgi:hypothetical protein